MSPAPTGAGGSGDAMPKFIHWSLPLTVAWISGNLWMFAECMKLPGVFADEPFVKVYVLWSARLTAAAIAAVAIWLQRRRATVVRPASDRAGLE